MSRFVSGGTNEEPTERDEAWLKAQQELDARHVAKQAASRQGEGKSLFETLEANKAAKQDAFEEANRLKNQFRSLDEDEIEFLDSVLECDRKKEAEVRKDTKEQLEVFRKQQEEAEKAAKLEGSAEPPAAGESWGVGPRKRKKGKEREGIGGVKLRRTSTTTKLESLESTPALPESVQSPGAGKPKTGDFPMTNQAGKSSPKPPTSPARPLVKPGLGLAAYSSDEDD